MNYYAALACLVKVKKNEFEWLDKMFPYLDQAIKFWKPEDNDNSDPEAPINKQSILYMAYTWV